MKQKSWTAKALVCGRIGLVRSLGRSGVPVALTVPTLHAFPLARSSRYVSEAVPVPHFAVHTEEAVEVLESWGARQAVKPVVFCNAESDVLLFAHYRERLSRHFEIPLASTELIEALVNKASFATLAIQYGLPTPLTLIPFSRQDCLVMAEQIGYPCIIKPIHQRHWHEPAFRDAVGGNSKAILVRSETDLRRIIDRFPVVDGREMIQEYIPGPDTQHYDFHCYIDRSGTPKGWVVGHKLRTYPIHFGQGAYTRYVHEPRIAEVCLDALARIGYVGKANINLKRHSVTGKDYILEINPRFSVWSVFDSSCGVNLALQQYKDALGIPVEPLAPHGRPQRWLWFANDLKAMRDYRRSGELTIWCWVKSYIQEPGRIEYQVFAWDDPFSLPLSWLDNLHRKAIYLYLGLKRRLGWKTRKGADYSLQ